MERWSRGGCACRLWMLCIILAGIFPFEGVRWLSLARRLKKRELARLVGRKVGANGAHKKASKIYSEKQAIQQKGSKMDIYLQDAELAIGKNKTDDAIKALGYLSQQPIGTSLRRLRGAFRVMQAVRRILGHPNASVVIAAKRCMSYWKYCIQRIQVGDLSPPPPPRDYIVQDINSSPGFAHVDGSRFIVSLKDCFRYEPPPPDGQIFEFAVHIEYYLFCWMGISSEYLQKIDSILHMMSRIDLSLRERIRRADYSVVDICHLNVEKFRTDMEKGLYDRYLKKQRQDEIEKIRQEYSENFGQTLKTHSSKYDTTKEPQGW
ncbi:hypothetical protein AAMO2058_001639400 [Amorphochlora amoebiformis]